MSVADVIEIDVHIHKSTDVDVWVSTTGDRRDAVQLRRGAVRIEKMGGGRMVMSISGTLAAGKGLA